jgi:hypothetical protein
VLDDMIILSHLSLEIITLECEGIVSLTISLLLIRDVKLLQCLIFCK